MYLSQVFKVNFMAVGGSIFIIFGCGVIGSLFGGYMIDTMCMKYDPSKVVKYALAGLGIIMAIAMYLLSTATSMTLAIAYMSVAMFCEKWVGATFWMMPAAISQKDDVGIVAGAMNFMGNIGGAIVPILVGMIVTLTGSYYWAIILFMAFAIGLCIFPIGINMNKKVGSAS
jgi:ACS family D-galactonate transporter-like MFS transporter